MTGRTFHVEHRREPSPFDLGEAMSLSFMTMNLPPIPHAPDVAVADLTAKTPDGRYAYDPKPVVTIQEMAELGYFSVTSVPFR